MLLRYTTTEEKKTRTRNVLFVADYEDGNNNNKNKHKKEEE